MKFALGCVLVCIFYAFMVGLTYPSFRARNKLEADAMCCSGFWPIALPILLGVRLGKSLESRAKQRRLLREAEANRLERELKALEAEL